MLDELIAGQKAYKDKGGLGLEKGEISKADQTSNVESINEQKKIEEKRKFCKFQN